MRLLDRNKTRIYYSFFVTAHPAFDSDGNYTGDETYTYTTPRAIEGVLRSERGQMLHEKFGIATQYSRVFVVDDMNCYMDVNTRVWINNSLDEPNDFIVVSKSKSYDHITYGLREVEAN